MPAGPFGADESDFVGDKFGGRSRETNALAEPGGEPRLVDAFGGDGEHRFLGPVDVGWVGFPAAAVRSVNILSAAQAARLLPSGSGWFHAKGTGEHRRFVDESG